MHLLQAAMETPVDCRERACHDDILLGVTGDKPSSESRNINTNIPKTIPAPSISPGPAVTTAPTASPHQKPRTGQTQETTAQINTQDIQERDTSHPAATALQTAAPAPAMFRSEVISSWDLALLWMKVKQNALESGDLERAELTVVLS